MTSAAPEPIRFLFDYLSPYAYLAWTQVFGLAARHGRSVEPVPVLFAALLNAHGQRGPAEIPAKRVYVFKDVLRLAHRLGVPLLPPPAHPFNPLLALRVSSLPLDQQPRRALIDGLYASTWGGGPGVTDPEVVAEIARGVGLDGDKVVAEAQSLETKQRLRQQTDDAIDEGAFGVPTLLVDGELFWGLDSLPHLERFLRGEDPVDHEQLERLQHLPVAAQRRIKPPER